MCGINVFYITGHWLDKRCYQFIGVDVAFGFAMSGFLSKIVIVVVRCW